MVKESYKRLIRDVLENSCSEESVILLRKKFTDESELSKDFFLRIVRRKPKFSCFQFFDELHNQLFLVNFFSKFGKTNSFKVETAI